MGSLYQAPIENWRYVAFRCLTFLRNGDYVIVLARPLSIDELPGRCNGRRPFERPCQRQNPYSFPCFRHAIKPYELLNGTL